MWVPVCTTRPGLAVIEPQSKLFEKYELVCTKGIAQVRQKETFELSIPKFTKQPSKVFKNQMIAAALTHPKRLVDCAMLVEEVFGEAKGSPATRLNEDAPD